MYILCDLLQAISGTRLLVLTKDCPLQDFIWPWKIQRAQRYILVNCITQPHSSGTQSVGPGPAVSKMQELVSGADPQPCPRPMETLRMGPSKPSRGFWLGIPALLSFPFHRKLYFNSNLSPQPHLSPRRDTPLSSALPGWQIISRDTTLLSTSKLAQNSLFTSRYERLSLKRSNRLKYGHLREMWISCRHKPFSKSVSLLLGWGKKISLSE